MIEEILNLQTNLGVQLSPEFTMLEPDDETINYWFDGDLEEAKNFKAFASNDSSGLFCFWNYQDVKNPPIVFLAEECVGSKVIANSIEEFFSLVSFGSEDYQLDIDYVKDDEEWEEIEDPTKEHLEFREWLKSNFNVSPADSPLKIIKAALENHPDLFKYIESWQEKKYGA